MKRLRNHPFLQFLVLTVLFPSFAGMPLWANPSGGEVKIGDVTIHESSGGTLNIDQFSDRAVIEWEDFSIGEGELTQFFQPGTSAAVLNRVVGGDVSAINGALKANGSVWIVNQNGVIFGPGSNVDVFGLIASTLDISDDDFMDGGDMQLSGGLGDTVNFGTINAAGGDVYLVGRNVTNHGIIGAVDGNIGLAAGNSVLLKASGSERVFVSAGEGSVTNTGELRSAMVELKAHGNVGALAINNTGMIRAGGASTVGGRVLLSAGNGNISSTGQIVSKNQDGSGGDIILTTGMGEIHVGGILDASGSSGIGGNISLLGPVVNVAPATIMNANGTEGGSIQLGSTPDEGHVHVEAGSQITANGTVGNGGNIDVTAGEVVIYGNSTIGASGELAGGNINLTSSGLVMIEGDLDASGRGAVGNGGRINLAGENVLVNQTGAVRADGGLNGGQVNVTAIDQIFVAGQVTALGEQGTGGRIRMVAEDILIPQTGRVDASGATGGSIAMSASDEIFIAGEVAARGTDGAGGMIAMSATDIVVAGSGLVDASGTDGGGFISLSAEDSATILGRVLATGGEGAGGTINIDGTDIFVGPDATIDASGATGGTINLSATDEMNIQGNVRAIGSDGAGGTINVSGTDVLIGPNATIDASGTSGGSINLKASREMNVNGTVRAVGSHGAGGNVNITGQEVNLGPQANVDVSGTTQGGVAQIGGGFQGSNPDLQNSQSTTIDASAIIQANASVGDGGLVAIWSDGATDFRGTATVTGSGNGGIVEVSGKETLTFAGSVNTSGVSGKNGTLILDPTNVRVAQVNGDGRTLAGEDEREPGIPTGAIDADAILTAWNSGNVVIHTSGPGSDIGNIIIESDVQIVGSTSNSLSFFANGDITVAPNEGTETGPVHIVNFGDGNINLVAGWNGGGASTFTGSPQGTSGAITAAQIRGGTYGTWGADGGDIFLNPDAVFGVEIGSAGGETNLFAGSLSAQNGNNEQENIHIGFNLHQLKALYDFNSTSGAIQALNPLAYWQFNGDATNSATAHIGTANGTTTGNYFAGRTGDAGDLALVASGAGVTIADFDHFDSIAAAGNNALSFSIWTYGSPSAVPSDNNFPVNGQSAGGTRTIFAHLPWNDRRVYWDSAGRVSYATTSDTQFKGEWNNWTFVRDAGAANFSGIYHNGQVVAQSSAQTADLEVLTSLTLGQNFHGLIDDVAIFDTALSAAEVASIYGAPAVPADIPVTGDINIETRGSILLTNEGGTRYIQVGHGGSLFDDDYTQDISGNININMESETGVLYTQGGSGASHVLIGHGGRNLTAQNLKGDINVDVNGLLLHTGENGSSTSFAQIGHGGVNVNANSEGAITVNTNDGLVDLLGGGTTGGAGSNRFSHIGHGGINIVGDLEGDIDIDGQRAALTAGHGLSANYAQIGHGGRNLDGDMTGDIAINLTEGNLDLQGGAGTRGNAQVGHGGYDINATTATRTLSGDITIETPASVNVIGGDSASGDHAFAKIGHGGGEIGTGATNGIIMEGDISINATTPGLDVTVQAGNGTYSHASIGHGTTETHNDTSASGTINVNGTGTLLVAGGDEANRGSFGQIGHHVLGNNVNFETTAGSDVSVAFNGNIDIRGGTGSEGAHAMIGHGGSIIGDDNPDTTPEMNLAGNVDVVTGGNLTVQGGNVTSFADDPSAFLINLTDATNGSNFVSGAHGANAVSGTSADFAAIAGTDLAGNPFSSRFRIADIDAGIGGFFAAATTAGVGQVAGDAGLLQTVLAGQNRGNPFALTVNQHATTTNVLAGEVATNGGPWAILNDNTTISYEGQFFDADGIIAFGENIDDQTRVTLASATGTHVLVDNATWNVPTTNAGGGTVDIGASVNGDGWYDIVVTMVEGGGGAGPVNQNGWSGSRGFGLIDPSVNAASTVDSNGSFAQIGNGGAGMHGTLSSIAGNTTVRANDSINVTNGAGTDAYAKIGLGDFLFDSGTSGLRGTRSGDINVSSGDDLTVSGGLIGHIDKTDFGEAIVVGNTYIAVSRDAAANGLGNLTVQADSNGNVGALSAGSELRLYMTDRTPGGETPGTVDNNQIASGSLLNGSAYDHPTVATLRAADEEIAIEHAFGVNSRGLPTGAFGPVGGYGGNYRIYYSGQVLTGAAGGGGDLPLGIESSDRPEALAPIIIQSRPIVVPDPVIEVPAPDLRPIANNTLKFESSDRIEDSIEPDAFRLENRPTNQAAKGVFTVDFEGSSTSEGRGRIVNSRGIEVGIPVGLDENPVAEGSGNIGVDSATGSGVNTEEGEGVEDSFDAFELDEGGGDAVMSDENDIFSGAGDAEMTDDPF